MRPDASCLRAARFPLWQRESAFFFPLVRRRRQLHDLAFPLTEAIECAVREHRGPLVEFELRSRLRTVGLVALHELETHPGAARVAVAADVLADADHAAVVIRDRLVCIDLFGLDAVALRGQFDQ